MLNRLYIVIGFLAIVVLIIAFIAPSLMNWSGYRERVEAIASEALGTKVSIGGEIDFSLLPRPRMSFEDIVVGSNGQVLVEIFSAEAQFSLMDFLRDRYIVKSLVLQSPKLFMHIDNKGNIVSELEIPENMNASNVLIADAEIKNGSVEFFDARNDKSWLFDRFEGRLNLGGLRGPYALQGNVSFNAKQYHIQMNSSDLNERHEMNLNVYFKPIDNSFSFRLAGRFLAGKQASFNGAVEYRQKVIDLETSLGISGDRLLNSKIEISSKKILLSEYVFLPDENRPATRLSGALEISLGENLYYNAVISGGVVDILLPDVSLNDDLPSNQLLDLLDEIQTPFIPPINGSVGIDISEMSIKGISLREIRIDAFSNDDGWLIEKFDAQLPGKTLLSFNGKFGDDNGQPVLDGDLLIDSQRIDILALTWRKARKNNALFNMAASLKGNVSFVNGKFALLGGEFVIDKVKNDISFGIDKNEDVYSIDMIAGLGEFNALQSEAVGELIPMFGASGSFSDVFSYGSFDILAKKVTLFDLLAQDLQTKGNWNGQTLNFEKLKVGDFGGVSFDLQGGYNASLKNHEIFGQGNINITAKAKKNTLTKLYEKISLPENLQNYLYPSLPASFSFALSKASQSKAQTFELSGRAGVADVNLKLNMISGALDFINSPLEAELELSSNNVSGLAQQLGLGDVLLVPLNSNMIVGLKLAGSIFNSLDVELSLKGGGEQSRFYGNLFVSNASLWKGKGKLEMLVGDFSPFLEILGVENIGAVPLVGQADLSFEGLNNLKFEAIDIVVNAIKINGDASRIQSDGQVIIDANLLANSIEVSSLAKLLGGPSSVLMGDEIWPQGPFSISNSAIKSTGRVNVKTPILRFESKNLASDVDFDFIWDENNLRIRSFEAKVGNAKIDFDVGICCKGSMIERQLGGRISLVDVDLGDLLPENPANFVKGNVNAGVSFSGSGDSFANIIGSLAGEGSFEISNLEIAEFNPKALYSLNEVENILEIDQAELENIVKAKLKSGSFRADKISGIMNIAGGNIRIANIGAKGGGEEIFGGIQLALSDLAIDGSWRLSSLLDEEQDGAIIANLSESLLAPMLELDLAQLIDSVKLRALDLELKRLERLQQEALERSKLAALARAKLMELAEQEKAKAAALALAEQQAKEKAARELAEQQALENSLTEEDNSLLDIPIELLPNAFEAPTLIFQ